MSSLAEIAGQTQVEGNAEVPKEVKESKGANGETGVAGNIQNSKRNQGVRGMGFFAGRDGASTQEKEKEKERHREKDKEQHHGQSNKASRRTTSLLNLFMSNSQGRSRSKTATKI